MRAVVLAVVAAACYQPARERACTATCDFAAHEVCPAGLECAPSGLCVEPGGGCGGGDDAAVDVPAPPPCNGIALLGHDLMYVCLKQPPTTDRSLSSSFDTATSSLCDATDVENPQADICYVVAGSIDVGRIEVTGPKRLVLVATDSITIGPTQVLDVSSNLGAVFGAGGNPTICDTTTANGSGEGGAAGGSNHGRGGDGGAPNTTGVAGTAPTPLVLGFRGGCSGGVVDAVANSGAGGGAVYLIAGIMITVSGAIDASGAGGAGGVQDTGGSGGGAGGFIGLDANMIAFSGGTILIAAGGGGGGGGGADSGPPGIAMGGGQPFTAPNNTGAGGAGGSGTPAGGRGGNGSPPPLPDGKAGLPSGGAGAGAGAGGGGAGYIRIWPGAAIPTTPLLIDPPAS